MRKNEPNPILPAHTCLVLSSENHWCRAVRILIAPDSRESSYVARAIPTDTFADPKIYEGLALQRARSDNAWADLCPQTSTSVMQGFHQSMSKPSKLPHRSTAHKADLTRLFHAGIDNALPLAWNNLQSLE
jgi:hypothetical protein